MGFAWVPAEERRPGALPETGPWPPAGTWPASATWPPLGTWLPTGRGAAGRHQSGRHAGRKPGRHTRPSGPA